MKVFLLAKGARPLDSTYGVSDIINFIPEKKKLLDNRLPLGAIKILT